ncbi:hypothetical protein ACH9L7_13790 [Haloferax sp. S1W]|uniref:hypothetical protein n=1 Tax=Haloferax sp. S1W TaxID=3377110 RepID=UPI0037CC9F0F
MATTESVRITDFDFAGSEDGNTHVVVELRNDGYEYQTRTVTIAGTCGEKRREETETVTVPPGKTRSVNVTLGIRFELFRMGGDLSFDLE